MHVKLFGILKSKRKKTRKKDFYWVAKHPASYMT